MSDIKKRMFILRREAALKGGAEHVASRYGRVFSDQFDTTVVNAGTTVDGYTVGGYTGGSSIRARRFASSIEKLLSKTKPAVVLSLERGCPCDIFRAGDGVHKEWLARRQKSSFTQHFNPWHKVAPALEKKSVENSKVIVANSEMVMMHLIDHYPEQADKIEVIYYGYDPERFKPSQIPRDTLKEKLGLPLGRPMALFCGGDWKREGFKEAIRMVGLGKTILKTEEASPYLVVVGKGDSKAYKGTIKKAGLSDSVFFHGNRDNMQDYFQAANVFLLPTLYDPFSNVCLEALACGCLVATTENNGAAEIIKHGETGYILFDTGLDVRREAVAWWLRNRMTPEQIANTVKNFTIMHEREHYRSLMREYDIGTE